MGLAVLRPCRHRPYGEGTERRRIWHVACGFEQGIGGSTSEHDHPAHLTLANDQLHQLCTAGAKRPSAGCQGILQVRHGERGATAVSTLKRFDRRVGDGRFTSTHHGVLMVPVRTLRLQRVASTKSAILADLLGET